MEFLLSYIMPRQSKSNLINKEGIVSPLETDVRYFSSMLSFTNYVIAGIAWKQIQKVK